MPGRSSGEYPSAGSGGYPMPPLGGAGGFASDSYSSQRSDSYQAHSPATAGYPQPAGSHQGDSHQGSYSPGAISGQYAAPPGGLSYGAGPADQTVAYTSSQDSGPHSSMPSAPHSGPHASPHSAPYQQPLGAGGYQGAGYQPGYHPEGDFVNSVPASFPGQNGDHPGPYPSYPPALPAGSSGTHGSQGFEPGAAALGGGYGQDHGSALTGPYPDGGYQPYDPPGYPSSAPSGGHGAADPYSLDPYGYSGYGDGRY